MRNRRRMGFGDWLNGGMILLAGVFIGVAADSMIRISGTAFWPVIFIVPILFGGVTLLVLRFDRFIDRIFPSGIRAPRRQKAKERRPLALLLSLPTGIAIGLIAAQFGLADLLL